MPQLLYDANCGFCRRVLNSYGRFLRPDVRAEPLQDFESADPRLQQHQLEESIKLVLEDGQVYSGAEAIARAIRGPFLLYFVPGIRQLANLAYTLVARNRHNLPGGCTVNSCERR